MKKALFPLLCLAALFLIVLPARADVLTLPAGLTEISAEAFMGDTSLSEVVLPDGLERIGERAFAGSSVKRIYLPDSIVYIAPSAFEGVQDATGYGPDGTIASAFFDAEANLRFERPLFSPENPITIQFWHNFSSGVNFNMVSTVVDTFNETVGAEKGIVVEHSFQGGFLAIYDKLLDSRQTGGELPAVCVSGGSNIVDEMFQEGLLADVMPFMAADGYDPGNFPAALLSAPHNDAAHLYSLPYLMTTPVFYYNKSMADEMGLVVPDLLDIAKMEELCKAAYRVDGDGETTVWGFECLDDFNYYQSAFLRQLGEPLWDENGNTPALEGESMRTVLSDWRRWVDEGWCRPYELFGGSYILREMLVNRQLFSCLSSCSMAPSFKNQMANAGYELGVSQLPFYGTDPCAPVTGGKLSLIDAGNSEAAQLAGWEFIKYLFSDDIAAYHTIQTGFMPVTYGVANSARMQDYWAEFPEIKAVYDQLDHVYEMNSPAYAYSANIVDEAQNVMDALIMERTITVEEALEQIKENIRPYTP